MSSMSPYSGEPVPATSDAAMASWIQSIERRLKNLELSPSLPNSSSKGGRVRLMDTDAHLLTLFGRFTSGTQDFQGHVMYDSQGQAMVMIRSDIEGLVHPEEDVPFVPLNQFTTVTSGSFVATHEYTPGRVYYDTLRMVLQVNTGSGTTGEIRLLHTSGGVATATTTLSLPANTSNVVRFEWIHPGAIGQAAFKSVFNIQARRTGGAGNVDVFTPREAHMMCSSLLPGATTNGGGLVA